MSLKIKGFREFSLILAVCLATGAALADVTNPGVIGDLAVDKAVNDAVDGFLIGKTYVIMDRDPVFTARVRDMLRHAGAKPVRLPRRSPNLNAVIPLGEAHLQELIRECMAHYNHSSHYPFVLCA